MRPSFVCDPAKGGALIRATGKAEPCLTSGGKAKAETLFGTASLRVKYVITVLTVYEGAEGPAGFCKSLFSWS